MARITLTVALVFVATVRLLGIDLSAASEITVTQTDGNMFSTGPFIKQFVLGDMTASQTMFALSDETPVVRKTWDEPVYGTQGSLIARKLLSFGTDDDVRKVRESLLTASINEDGFVDGALSKRWHLGEKKATIESNAEYVLMARDYLAHTDDVSLFHAPISRIVCIRGGNAPWTSVVHQTGFSFDCGRIQNDYTSNNTSVFYERLRESSHGADEDMGSFTNPGRILGQVFEATSTFDQIRIPLAKHNPPTRPFRIYLVKSGAPAVINEVINPEENPAVLDKGWLALNFAEQGPGIYNIELHPVSNVSDDLSARLKSYWHSIAWLTDVGSHVKGGATTKLYWNDPYIPSQSWTVASKVEAALNWALRRSQSTGRLGIFINPLSRLRGTGQVGVSSSSYYDLLKSGYKDSYVILRYLEALSAYADVQAAGVVRPQITEADIANVKSDFIRQMVDPSTGNVVSWIGCSMYQDELTPLCDPGSVSDGQHPYDVGFVPAQALAARLLNDDGSHPHIAARLSDQRTRARMYSADGTTAVKGLFRTNTIPVEEVTAGIWDANSTWNEETMIGDYPNGVFYSAYDRSHPDHSDWHMFKNGLGNGNFGNQEENGGALLSTTSFLFEAGPYPEMYDDFKSFVSKMNLVSAWVARPGAGHDVAAFQGYLRKQMTDQRVRELCARPRTNPRGGKLSDLKADPLGKTICDYYKSVSYHLPESGAVAHSFVVGLLKLRLSVSSGASIYGQPFDFDRRGLNGRFVGPDIAMTQAEISQWPIEVESIRVSGLRVAGRVVTLSCGRISAGLRCSVS
jgi:hypothetical protein